MSHTQQITNAVAQLRKSEAGNNALTALLSWLDDDGLTLDAVNQEAVFQLLAHAWGGYAGSTRDLMRKAVTP